PRYISHVFCLVLPCYSDAPDLHSFPTRRSSDLKLTCLNSKEPDVSVIVLASVSSISSTSSSNIEKTRSAPATAESKILNWLDNSFKGLVNCGAYWVKITMTPTVIKPFITNIQQNRAMREKLKKFNVFITFGIKPEMVFAQNPDRCNVLLFSLNSSITRSSWEYVLTTC